MSERRTFEFLNVMRFVSALWVVLSHLGAPPLDSLASGTNAELIRKALIVPFSGVAAVMVFFVISGFCIHYAHMVGTRLDVVSFYLRRFTRIGLPLLLAVALHQWWGTERWLKNVLWSVYCELIYYAAYPALRMAMARVGALQVAIIALAISWLFCLQSDEGFGHIIAYGNVWTWLVCLPTWLGGCALAEWVAGVRVEPCYARSVSGWTERNLVMARWAVWAASSILLILGMKEILPFKYSLPVFGLCMVPWFMAEMRRPDVITWMGKLGAGGYSIYLMHLVSQPQEGRHLFDSLHPLLGWILRMMVAAIVSAAFYMVVERPSHMLARLLGGWWRKKSISTEP